MSETADDLAQIKTDLSVIRVYVEELRDDVTRLWEDHEARLRSLESGKSNSALTQKLEDRVTSLEIGQNELRVRQGILSTIAAGIGVIAAAIAGWLGR